MTALFAALLFTALPMPDRAPIVCEPVPIIVCEMDPDTGHMVFVLDYVLACGPQDSHP